MSSFEDYRLTKTRVRKIYDFAPYTQKDLAGFLSNYKLVRSAWCRGYDETDLSKQLKRDIDAGLLTYNDITDRYCMLKLNYMKMVSPFNAEDIAKALSTESEKKIVKVDAVIEVKTKVQNNVVVKQESRVYTYPSVTYKVGESEITSKYVLGYPYVSGFPAQMEGYKDCGPVDRELYVACSLVAASVHFTNGSIAANGETIAKIDGFGFMYEQYMKVKHYNIKFVGEFVGVLSKIFTEMGLPLPSTLNGLELAHHLYVMLYGFANKKNFSSYVFSLAEAIGIRTKEVQIGNSNNGPVTRTMFTGNASFPIAIPTYSAQNMFDWYEVVSASRAFRGKDGFGISGMTQCYTVPGFSNEENMRISAYAADIKHLCSMTKTKTIRLMLEQQGFNTNGVLGIARLLPEITIYVNGSVTGTRLPRNLKISMVKLQGVRDFYAKVVRASGQLVSLPTQSPYQAYVKKEQDEDTGIVPSVLGYREMDTDIAFYCDASYAFCSKEMAGWFVPCRIHTGLIVIVRQSDVRQSRGVSGKEGTIGLLDNDRRLLRDSIIYSNVVRDFLPWTKRYVWQFAQTLGRALYLSNPVLGALGNAKHIVGNLEGLYGEYEESEITVGEGEIDVLSQKEKYYHDQPVDKQVNGGSVIGAEYSASPGSLSVSTSSVGSNKNANTNISNNQDDGVVFNSLEGEL